MLLTLAKLKTPRVPNDTCAPQTAVARRGQELLPVLAVVPDEVRGCVVAGPELEQAGSCGGGVEEPLFDAVVLSGGDEKGLAGDPLDCCDGTIVCTANNVQ